MKTAVLISGRGSNLAALIATARDPAYPARLALVISNKPDAAGLEYARQAGITTVTIISKNKPREVFDAELDQVLIAHDIELIALAGFMRILTPDFVRGWAGRIVNIHPSLLPAYRGIHVHERVIADRATQSGCSVHFVTPGLDEGPVIAQETVPVLADDTPESLAARVLVAEHRP